jgi:hypothetical protein
MFFLIHLPLKKLGGKLREPTNKLTLAKAMLWTEILGNKHGDIFKGAYNTTVDTCVAFLA